MVSISLLLLSFTNLTIFVAGDTTVPSAFTELYSTNLSATTFMPLAVNRVAAISDGWLSVVLRNAKQGTPPHARPKLNFDALFSIVHPSNT